MQILEEVRTITKDKNYSAITKSRSSWIWRWAEPESVLTVIPKSRTQRLAAQAKLANIDAERAFSRAYRAELTRIKAIAEVMYKSAKALKYTAYSSGRQILLRVESARRGFEPGYRNR